jgi:lipopolysaccharide/colanic/teichoic acid biosynthesis glycosyltransferase|tara:strand:+ start:135 stop:368 length:234 start_codon:yes stop_codon:yes gene_type:complete
LRWQKENKNDKQMVKRAQDNAAEIIITVVAIIILLSSCGTTSSSVMKHGVSPKYMQLNDCCVKTANEVYKYEGLCID